MQTVFNLEHIYEENGIDEIKFVGIFSSIIKAQAAIDFLFTKQGFNKYPKECFQIHEIRIDEFEWKEGFLSWEEALNK